MKKLKKAINNLRVWYYDNKMTYCLERWEFARLIHDESHRACTKWIDLYDKCEAKLHKIRIE